MQFVSLIEKNVWKKVALLSFKKYMFFSLGLWKCNFEEESIFERGKKQKFVSLDLKHKWIANEFVMHIFKVWLEKKIHSHFWMGLGKMFYFTLFQVYFEFGSRDPKGSSVNIHITRRLKSM